MKYTSKSGVVKTLDEWKIAAEAFFKDAGMKPVDYWERFQRVLGLVPGEDNEQRVRKPYRLYNENGYYASRERKTNETGE
jgi:hypothetical protein